jgi:hypothetical protein
MGVFATRSPFRPNPIGLSSVRLISVQQSAVSHQLELLVSGADLMDGTPIYDIKPYLSFSDCHEDAKNGFAEEHKDDRLEVSWDLISRHWTDIGPTLDRHWTDEEWEKWREDVTYILSQDPRPAYQDDPAREYKMDYAGWRVTFRVEGQKVIVVKVERQND